MSIYDRAERARLKDSLDMKKIYTALYLRDAEEKVLQERHSGRFDPWKDFMIW
jgi:hypothetical protein